MPQGKRDATTVYGGSGGGGTVFELSPSHGQWQFTLLYKFTGSSGPVSGNLTMDQSGNLYGTTAEDGLYDLGMVFKLTPSNGSWTLTDLHDFTGGSDGASPSLRCAAFLSGTPTAPLRMEVIRVGLAVRRVAGVVWEIAP